MSDFILYGIPNCDTVKKAKRWFEDKAVAYRFHDFRKDGLDAALLVPWLDNLGADVLINKRGTTWRKLGQDEQALAEDDPVTLLSRYPAIVKRPVIAGPHGLSIGFTAKVQDEIAEALA